MFSGSVLKSLADASISRRKLRVPAALPPPLAQVEVLQRRFARLEQERGAQHPETLQALAHLAELLQAQGDLRQADSEPSLPQGTLTSVRSKKLRRRRHRRGGHRTPRTHKKNRYPPAGFFTSGGCDYENGGVRPHTSLDSEPSLLHQRRLELRGM